MMAMWRDIHAPKQKMLRLIAIVAILLQMCTLIHSRREGNHQSFQTDENLMFSMCQLRLCQRNTTTPCRIPISTCKQHLLPLPKYGECPSRSNEKRSNETLCIDECSSQDYRCPNTHKCCSYKCGRSCLSVSLHSISNDVLLPIPHHVSVISVPYHRNWAELSWTMDTPLMSISPAMYFVVEARAHAGFTFAKHRLSKWFNINYEFTSSSSRSFRMEYNVIVRLRLGRWYEFRIAALNEHGIRGYSAQSPRFQLKERPKNPTPPRDFTIAVPPRLTANNTVYVKLIWRQPRTDYVIEKYKISWALHLQSDNGTLIESLWYNDAYIQEPIRYFEFYDLAPNSYYYIQLQALSTFGRKKLKSPKVTQFLNTTIFSMDKNRNLTLTTSQTLDSHNVTVRILANTKHGMVVRVSWALKLIGSWLELCAGDADCLRKPNIRVFKRVNARKSNYDFFDLKKNTRYSVKINSAPSNFEMIKSFTTPSCERFNLQHPQMSEKC